MSCWRPVSRVTDRRGLLVAIVVGLAAGGLALLGAGRPWATVEIAVPGVPSSTIETAGTSAVPWVGALTLVILAGALALVPTGGRVRRAIGVIVFLAAVGSAAGTLAAGSAIDDALREDLAESPASGGVDDEAVVASADHPAWRWLTLGGSAAGVLVGLLVTTQGHRWPTMGGRYEAPTPRRVDAAAPSDPSRSDGAEDADLWRALDEGRDPTA
jgi:uncharacterized membrane protein (TIGR02234 family)